MQEKEDSYCTDIRNSFNVIVMIANIHATCLLPFIRCNFGTNAPGLTACGSLLLILVVVSETQDQAMLAYLLLWLAALMYQRARTNWLVARGWQVHSRYWGWPWLAMLFLVKKSEDRAKNLEPLLCFFIGGLLCSVSPNLGFLVLSGIVSLTITRGVYLEATKRRVTAMRDLQIEQKVFAEQVRNWGKDF